MTNPDRLTGLDASFLHLERDAAHMHVGSVFVFDGEPPPYLDFVAHIEGRLHLVPRYRQKLAFVPLNQGRPVWVDDPHFNVRYHLRHSALPSPGGDDELKALAGRILSQELDRAKPLWEMNLVEGVQGNRFAIVAKTHHCLVDGVSGVDITTVMFDTAPEPAPIPPPERPWMPRPEPSDAQLLADALLERATVPAEVLRGARATVRGPRRMLSRISDDLSGLTAQVRASGRAPQSPFNVRISPHRRFTWTRVELALFKAIKDELGGTVNDVVLTVVDLALGSYLRSRGFPTDGIVLRAMVPVSVRTRDEQGALGNRVAAMYAPMPVDKRDPIACFEYMHGAMADLKESHQAVGAQVIAAMADFAPPTILAQAARLQARQRYFNFVVTNVPGPQFGLYVLGRRLEAMFPQVPLPKNVALGIAIISYDGTVNFGLLGDYDALPDLDDVADDLDAAIADLADAAGVEHAISSRQEVAGARAGADADADGGDPEHSIPPASTGR